jgi:GT2 family glycosyltransferase/glycosyltransferase involved in cell wall biosynthesis
MHRFWTSIIEPILTLQMPKVMVEIGSGSGEHTHRLLDFCRAHDVVLHTIDPSPSYDVDIWKEEYGKNFIFHRLMSLNALPLIKEMDVVMIDGDHNWYTVFHELQLIEKLSHESDRNFPIVFLHDIGWPYGRRDMYYDPENIPDAYRKPYSRMGISPETPELVKEGGLNPHLANAIYENELQSGVLTAIEDFIDASKEALELYQVRGFHGLGILLPILLKKENAELGSFFNTLDEIIGPTPYIDELEQGRIKAEITADQRLTRFHKYQDEWKDERSRILNKLDDEQQQVINLKADLEDEKNKVSDLQTSIKESNEQISELLSRLDEMELKLEEAQDEFEAQSQVISTIQLELNEKVKEIDEQSRHFKDLHAQLEEKTKDVESLFSDNQATENKLMDAIKDIANLQQKLRITDNDTKILISWIEDLEGGVAALISTRRWKVGNRLGDLWQRISRKPLVPMATDLFDHIFSLFHTWHEGWRERQRKKNDKDLIIPVDTVSTDHVREDATKARTELEALTSDIVICVHNALDDVKRCFASVVSHTDPRHRLIIVDDGSDTDTSEYLRGFSETVIDCVLISNDKAKGYTKAANQGLRASQGDYVILLNSDTIVTPGWLEKILECGESDSKIGVIGPLSNSASWQSIPELYDRTVGDWATNPLPKGWTPSDMAEVVASISDSRFPRVPLINGFCYAIKREVIDAIGYFDEESFPQGFAEENDYSLRVTDAGFVLAIADHAFVYHAKSRSYTDERRRALSKQTMVVLREKHSGKRIDDSVTYMRQEPILEEMRQRIRLRIDDLLHSPEGKKARVLFILPVPGGAGGAHSVVTEALAMRRMGVDAQVSTELRFLPKYRANYPNIEELHEVFYFYQTMDELVDYASNFDVVVGTIYHSMNEVKIIVEANPNVRSAYYIQDYEPWFFNEGSKERKIARASYNLIPLATLFAKTDWICSRVETEHDVFVHKVSPSIDHEIFYPPLRVRKDSFPVKISAMIRPKTAHRGGARTMRILSRIKQDFNEKVDIHIFGCSEEEIAAHGLTNDFIYSTHGFLIREEVGDLLRQMDVFIDFSDWQAFGRTGLEAMACGCATIVPEAGGTTEYAIDGHNALLVDTSSEDSCYEVLRELITDEGFRWRLQDKAPHKAAEYSTYRAAMSELLVLFEGDQIGI